MIYQEIEYSDEMQMAYLIKDGLKQLVSFDGAVKESFVINWSCPLLYDSYNSELGEVKQVQHDYLVEYGIGFGLYGVMDSRTGKIIVPALYDDITLISPYLIQAEMDADDNSVIFDLDGKKVN